MIKILFSFIFMLFFTLSHAVELKILEWEGYISPYAKDFEAYAKSQGVDVKLIISKPYIFNPDQIFQAVRLNEADVVTPTHNYYKMSQSKLLKILQPIDFNRLKNYNDLTPSVKNTTYDNYKAQKYSVPLLGGSYGLAYNTKKVSEPKSWNVLWDDKSKGKYSITDEQFEANLYITILALGYAPESCFNIDSNIDVAKVKTKLNTLVNNSGSFWKGIPDIKEMEELHYMTDYWFGVALANQNGQNWKLANPKEGQTVWLDTMAISKSVTDKKKLEAAYMLLDFMISPAIQKRIHEMYGSVIVNKKTAALMSEAQIEASHIHNTNFFKEEYFWKPLSIRTRNAFKTLWLKALQESNKE